MNTYKNKINENKRFYTPPSSNSNLKFKNQNINITGKKAEINN